MHIVTHLHPRAPPHRRGFSFFGGGADTTASISAPDSVSAAAASPAVAAACRQVCEGCQENEANLRSPLQIDHIFPNLEEDVVPWIIKGL